MDITRRDFLVGLITAGSGAVVACGPESGASQAKNKIPLTNISKANLSETKPATSQRTVRDIIAEASSSPAQEIPRTHLLSLIDSIRNSGVPLYRMLGDHIASLASSPDTPKSFPNWFDKTSIPLKVTVNKDLQSAVIPRAYPNQDPENDFLVEYKTGQNIPYYPIDRLQIREIRLGLPDHIRAAGALTESFYLLKEYISMVTMLRVLMEGVDIYQPAFVTFKDKLGRSVTDPQKQMLYGATFGIYQSNVTTTHTFKVMDSLPAYLVADQLRPLMDAGKLPTQTTTLSSFYHGLGLLLDHKDWDAEVKDINNQWVKSGEVLPPSGLGIRTFKEPLYTAIQSLDAVLYKPG